MTDEEINIAIAEACGLFKIEPLRRTTRKGKTDPNGVVLWYCEEHHGGAATYARVPDYCNNLDAMHEAEKMLTEGSWKEVIHATNKYTNELCKVLGCLDTALFQFAHATARQRAEAFLRTLNLWVE